MIKSALRFSIAILPLHSLLPQVTGLSGWNLYIDPGHSGTENMGIYGYSEAEKNLRVALELKHLLETVTDIDTVFISRTNDNQQVSLSQRTDHANNAFGPSQPAAWFHSLHSDAGSPRYNSTLLLWGQYNNGDEKDPKGGRAMSDIMVDLLTRGMRTTTRGSIGDCSFYSWSDWCEQTGGPYLFVNRNTVMPSELSEAGFHTNPVQNQRNMNDRWKRLEALTFFWSVLKYRGIDRPFVGILTGIISDLETGVPINGATVTVNGRSDTTDSFESLFHRYSDDPDLLHNGVYFLENLPPDTLEVKVEAGDYYSRMLPVAVVDTFFTFVDVELISKVPPTVVSTRPVQGDTNIPAWNPVVFEFSRKMNRVSVETTLVVDPPAHRQFVWSEDDTEMRLEGDTLHFETAYTVTVSGDALDHWGHPFDGDGDGTGGDHFVLSFTTGPPDMSPPRIASAYPPLYATGVELNPIVSITFDEEVAAGSISDDKFRLERFSDGSVVPGILEHYVVRGRSVLSFFPSESLHPDEIYETTIYAGLKDLSGNEMTSAKAFSFRTSPDTWEITTIEDFESGVTSNWWQPSQSYHYFGTVPDSTGMGVSLSTVNLLSESSQSMRLNYGWDTGASEWLIREYLCCGAPRDLHFDDGYLLQVYIFGDGSGNLFRFSVDDRVPVSAAENHEVSPWYPVDWIGWRLVSWDMTRDGTGSWIGDGSLDGTLRFDSIQLTHSPGSDPFGVLYFDDLRLARVSTINVSEGPVLLPHRFVLHQNIPNPFNPVTEISYELPVRAYVRLSVYDVLGRLVRTLVNTVEEPGLRTVRWDGTGNDYQPVASGTYLIRLDARADRDGVQGEDHRRFIRTRRAVLLR